MRGSGRCCCRRSPLEAVVVEVEARAVPVDLEAWAWAKGHVAVLVEVVAVGGRTGGLEEDLVVAAGEHRIEVAGVGPCGDLDQRRAGLPRAPEAARDVPHLRL